MNMVMEESDKVKLNLRCDKCNSKNIYTIKDGTLICRRCGHRKEKKK